MRTSTRLAARAASDTGCTGSSTAAELDAGHAGPGPHRRDRPVVASPQARRGFASGQRAGHHFQIRTWGTLGGAIAQADPAAAYEAVALALDAQMDVLSSTWSRQIAAKDFLREKWPDRNPSRL